MTPTAAVVPASIGRSARLGFILAIIVLLASGAFAYYNIRRISVNEGWVVHTYQVLDVLHDVLTTMSEAETSQRGYIVTGEKSFTGPYESATQKLQQHLDQVKFLVQDNPPQEKRAHDLEELCATRLRSLAEGITLRETQGFEAGRDFILSGKGTQEMESVRAVAAEMISVELGLLDLRKAESESSYHRAIITIILSTVLGLGMVGSGFAGALRELKTREQGAAALRKANDELEMRVHERTRDLEETNTSLQRSNRELEQFASVASHDLQEPLRKIQAFGDRLKTKCATELGENGRDYLERMQASATRMRSLIDALLSYSRVTTKAQPFVPVDLNLIAQDVVSDLEDRATRSGGRIEVSPLPTLEADPLQMRQLLQNLIANGLKFSVPEKPPLVQVAARMLPRENGAESAECLEISVRDNGIGFEEIYLDRIFELFQRLHGRQEYEGTGMGLAICRKIVERHSGTITARSAPGDGATFLITLPQRQEKET